MTIVALPFKTDAQFVVEEATTPTISPCQISALITITHITEIVGMEQDTIVMQDIYNYVQEGIDENGTARGKFISSGIRPNFMDRLESVGVRLPSSAFRERVMLVD